MGAHINERGLFQSDKYPSCPPDKVPLSVKDPMAADLLWEYAQRRRAVDAEFSDDLEARLRAVGYAAAADALGHAAAEAVAARAAAYREAEREAAAADAALIESWHGDLADPAAVARVEAARAALAASVRAEADARAALDAALAAHDALAARPAPDGGERG